jgi:putative copper export protein
MGDVPAYDTLGTVARAIALGGIVVVGGALAFFAGVLRRWRLPPDAQVAEWSRLAARSCARAAAVLLLDAPVRLYCQARVLVPPGDPVAPMMANVLRTAWGQGWLVQCFASLGVLAGVVLALRLVRGGWPLACLSGAALTLSPALMGHAVAAERFLALSIGADWLHVSMASAWLGGVAMLALIANRALAANDGPESFARVIELFHPLALTCSIGLVVTGVTSLLLRVDHLADLLHSTYGALFAVKMILTACVVAVGYRHARRGPAIVRAQGVGALTRTLALEVVFAVLVISATAALVGTSPPMPDSMPM